MVRFALNVRRDLALIRAVAEDGGHSPAYWSLTRRDEPASISSGPSALRLLETFTMPSMTLTAIVFYVLAAPALGGGQTDLGKKIVAFCEDHKGQCVGGGECSDLVEAALRASGGQRRGPEVPNPGDYTWGKQLYCVERIGNKLKTTGQIKSVRPGDIVQIRDAKWMKTEPDGRWSYKTYPHHTAVVSAVASGGKAIKVYEQNVSGRRIVTTGRIALIGLREGWIRIYRPRVADDAGEDDRSR